jgi:hypothetical protein
MISSTLKAAIRPHDSGPVWIAKPHLTLQHLTPTMSCGPETPEPSNLPKCDFRGVSTWELEPTLLKQMMVQPSGLIVPITARNLCLP